MKIAVLLATFNRKDKTLACLHNLKSQEIPEGPDLEIFLTDDASTDGTSEAIQAQFPETNVYHGNGSLFWAGGMIQSWTNALSSKADYYLLLNDDTNLKRDAVKILLNCCSEFYTKHGSQAIGVGTTQDPDSKEITYGGRKLFSKYKPQSYRVQPGEHSIECDMANSNIMLVPAEIVTKIGILSKEFTHAIADFDYTLRARKAGFSVIVAPGILGDCANDHAQNWKSSQVKLSERVKYLYSVKGLAYKEYLLFIKKHFPLNLPASFFKLWLKTLFPIVYDLFKKAA
ncbi:MAG: glycosyltransferase family 2 protein [Haliscomenobacter sp.]|uniref:glycosyltransferase family 2 protein n=1 Tax=Haliscomenobacter sp. TaxID=2717303 RepID=UPI0029BA63E7|nr:glycosyltransferase family 2 protein [Haliscomenobacter sp.]MDX2072290.1 glycosyltransferase family 2 protein [Haliscomenobacter sp.]